MNCCNIVFMPCSHGFLSMLSEKRGKNIIPIGILCLFLENELKHQVQKVNSQKKRKGKERKRERKGKERKKGRGTEALTPSRLVKNQLQILPSLIKIVSAIWRENLFSNWVSASQSDSIPQIHFSICSRKKKKIGKSNKKFKNKHLRIGSGD